ncbi:MAG TPA: S8 family serine peptidase [Baekduia sp.]|uniref:S8 family peptidase n=1 Tax=Baekduia sp. TaxID=2600305 RepID=UPI002C8D44EA|nr:S8 family serine peptidase [Baekduia sp.]HMJ35279.1 S8 family serine peptidase [Baekduia sp.]
MFCATRLGGSRPTSFELLRRRALPAAVGGCALLLSWALASPAHAEEVFTSQSAAAHATDSTWIAAPARPAAVCIVDTGNDANPDTTNVIARLAVDGGDGSDLDTTGHHGTLMSMIASAPYNGFGMVGAAPSVKVVSVRATRPGNGGGFAFSDVITSLTLCRKHQAVYNIKVISLSLGIRNRGDLDIDSQKAMQEAVDKARQAGIAVVAAAGNHPGAVDYPAAYLPVVAVAASDTAGTTCAFAALGLEVDLMAPGCPQDVALPDGRAAWASGSSESAAYVSAILAQLRALRPELSLDQAEGFLAPTTGPAAGNLIDVGAAFRAAGLDVQLAQGHNAMPPSIAPGPADASNADHPMQTLTGSGAAEQPAASDRALPPATSPNVGPQPKSVTAKVPLRLPEPRVRIWRYRRGHLTLMLGNRPPGAQADVRIYARRRGHNLPTLVRRVRMIRDRLRTQVLGTLSQVSISYRDPTGKHSNSSAFIRRP